MAVKEFFFSGKADDQRLLAADKRWDCYCYYNMLAQWLGLFMGEICNGRSYQSV